MGLWKSDTMLSLDDAVVARLDKGGDRFEILVDPDIHEKMEKGVPVEDVVAVDEVFKDARKGDRASETGMKKVFPDMSFQQVLEAILEKGSIQFTTEQRRKMKEDRWKAVVAEVARNCFNPKTGTPHPPNRIESAMEEVKFQVDPGKSVRSQVNKAVDAIAMLLPITFDKVKMAVKINNIDAGRAFGELSSFGELLQDEWSKNGEWIGVVSIPGGMQTELMDLLNKRFKNGFEVKLIGRKN